MKKMEWIRRSRMEDDDDDDEVTSSSSFGVMSGEDVSVKQRNGSTAFCNNNNHYQPQFLFSLPQPPPPHRNEQQQQMHLLRHKQPQPQLRNHHDHNNSSNKRRNCNNKMSIGSRLKKDSSSCSSSVSKLLFRFLFGLSLLLNAVIVGPLLLLSTPKVALMSDGVSIQLSHGRIENLLQSQQQNQQSADNDGSVVGAGSLSSITKGSVIQSPTFSQAIGIQELNRHGKSCIFVPQTNSWKCQDCGSSNSDNDGTLNDTTTADQQQNCKELQRGRNKCDKPMIRNPWDNPPRAYSSYDPTVVDDIEMRTIRELSYGHTMYLKQPLCTIEQCFDLSRCNSSVLTIYTNASSSTAKSNNDTKITDDTPSGEFLLDYAVQHSTTKRIKLQRVDHPSQACMSIVFPDTYKTSQEMYSAEHWTLYDDKPNHQQQSPPPRRQRGGRNNLVWDMGNFQGPGMSSWTGDHPFQQFHTEYAAVASQSLNAPLVRQNYDMVLPLRRKWRRKVPPNAVNIHRSPRRWLLSFRGDIQHKGIPYYSHRWLASEYWDDEDDILVDVQCRYRKKMYKPYDYPSRIYDEMMWNSTFGFCPGGGGVSSYRLGEYMSTGTIPVVVGDIVPPFGSDDGLDWSKCWIQVAESRIVDLPNILRRISRDEIRQRQQHCWKLHQMIWGELQVHDKKGGWIDNPAVTFTKGMEIWAVRIANALESQQRAKQILGYDLSS